MKNILNTWKLNRNAKEKYWNNIKENINQKNSYKLVKNMNNKRNNVLGLINKKEEIIVDPKIISNNICKFFSECGKSNISNSQRDKKNAAVNKLITDIKQIIDKQEISEVIKEMNIKKASGPDQISPFMLKYGGKSIINSLYILFNLILEKGKIPDIWKEAIIIPIPKKNDKIIKVEEFRPISLTSIIAKIMEKIIIRRVASIGEVNNWLPKFQTGFRKESSTLNNLITFQQEIHSAFKNKEYMTSVFLDIRKAYDCVNRDILCNKLEKLGIRGNILNFLKNSLGRREARVNFKGEISQKIEFKKGLPQGSPLSPLLFNIYVMDLKKIFKNNMVSQFADDLVIWNRSENINRSTNIVNKMLKKLEDWSKNVELEFSPNKCKALIFSRKHKLENLPDLFLKGKKLEIVEEYKYLGINFDRKVNWKHHINEICKTANKRSSILSFLAKGKGIHQKQMLTLYKSMVRPTLEYGAEVWGDTALCYKKKLDSIQHCCLTKALGVNRLAHKKDVNFEAKVWPLELRRDYQILKCAKKLKKTNRKYLYIKRPRENERLIEKSRKSFRERLSSVLENYGLRSSTIVKMKKENIRRKIDEKWRNDLILEGTYEGVNNIREYIDVDKTKYIAISKDRQLNSIWHQSRLGVLPVNKFLYSINRAKSEYCAHCKEKESIDHLFLDCRDKKLDKNKKVRRNVKKDLMFLKEKPKEEYEAKNV